MLRVAQYCVPVVSVEATGDQGSVRLEGRDGVVNASLSFTDGVAEAQLVGARFWSDKNSHLYDLTMQTDSRHPFPSGRDPCG